MAKKKDAQQEPEEELLELPVELPTGYVEKSWSGLPKYDCVKCAFDTLDLDVMLEHLVHAHSGIVPLLEIPPNLGESTHPAEGEVAIGIYEVTLKEVRND